MNFSFIFKTLFISFFMFMLIFAINISSIQQDIVSSNNFSVKNVVKESLNIGYLRVYDEVTYDNEILLSSTLNNYSFNNNYKFDNVDFDIAVNDNIVTVGISTGKSIFNKFSGATGVFSYKVERRQ